MGKKFVAEDFPCAALPFARGKPATHAAVVREAERDAGIGQRHAPQHLVAVGVFGGFGLEEFAPCRGIEIQVGDFDNCSHRDRRRFYG